MTHESAVEFATNSRIHMGLAVEHLDSSIAFYSTLFGQEPTKRRPNYAKFEVAQPAVNLALNETGIKFPPTNPIAHFGIQVKSTRAVREVADRLKEAGYKISVEENVTCCYAVQNKIWAIDPDGNKWEVYVVLNNDAGRSTAGGSCCEPASESKNAKHGTCCASTLGVAQSPGQPALASHGEHQCSVKTL
jgi:catechol 2,3-dioxygenase-like lactoylglutathione lyase family enzyme